LREIIDNDIKPNVSIVVNNNNRAKLSVKTDANCELIEDDQSIATLQEGTTKQLFVEKGEHEFIARSTEYNDIEQSIEKLIDDINSKYLLKIELANQVQERKNEYKLLQTLEGHLLQVRSVAYSPDGTKIVSVSETNTIKIWDANIGQCLKTLEGYSWGVNSVAFSPDGTKIISGSETKTIKIWDANTGQCLKTLYGHSSWVRSVVYSPDGTKIISGSDDATVRIWGVE
ncbi:MAG: WD40 repeat domain-containing protein, partial [Bacteroidales bacterium]|nr:WD40 repeat domain-containing protein [Bacteroidales bacterium]